MKKILFLHSSSELYGSDKSLLYLISSLDKKKYNIYVMLPEQGPLVDKLSEIDGIKIFVDDLAVLRRKYFSLLGMLKYFKSLYHSYKYIFQVVKREDVDIIYTNTSVVFTGGIVAKRLKKKSVWHIREIISNKYERRIVATIINLFSDVIVSNSRATSNSITSNSKKSKVVYNAVREFSEKRKTGKKNLKVGMIGRINRWKGQKLFVDMANIVHQRSPDTQFIIAGSTVKGEERFLTELSDYICSYGLQDTVTLIGQIDDVESFYNDLDVYIHPSIQPEPFGLVIIEAMDMSLPVIATNHGGPVEIIENAETGYLVDYLEPDEMAEKCIYLLENQSIREKMGEKAKREKRKKFSLEKTVSNVEEILDSISTQ